jgi:hypothetical protein
MLLYRKVLERKDIILEEYIKVFQLLRHVPEPVKQMIQLILKEQPINKDVFISQIKDYLG